MKADTVRMRQLKYEGFQLQNTGLQQLNTETGETIDKSPAESSAGSFVSARKDPVCSTLALD